MYEQILVPTDGGQEMSAVAEHALGLAELCDAELHILFVVDDRAYSSIPDEARDQVRDALTEDGEDAIRTVSERAYECDIDTVQEIRWGNPAAAILAYAKEHDIDLIVMGTHGRTGYEHYLLGSVAEKVVRASTNPVLTIYVGETADEETFVELG